MRKQLVSVLVSICLVLTLVFTALAKTSPDGIWSELAEQKLKDYETAKPGKTLLIKPNTFRVFTLNEQFLENVLTTTPLERLDLHPAARPMPALIHLPTPEGTYATFEFVESPVMAAELAAKYPEIKTYLGKSVSNSSMWVRFDWTPAGFHAQILTPGNTWYIDPYYKGETYASYYKRDYRPRDKFIECLTEAAGIERPIPSAGRSGDNLHEYRLAVACTGEYGQFHGGTVPLALSAIVTTVNRVTGIYEYELAIRLTLIANNDDIVYTDPATDPFDGNNDAWVLIHESQTQIDDTIGNTNYDIGHTFSTGAGGLAWLGAVCQTGLKARGVTGNPSPTGDPFDVDYVAHEVGHQFGANHTFNGTISNCSGSNRNGPTAYEPGSGSTIMAYAGICGADDLQPNSDPIFHAASHEEIIDYITNGSGACATVTSLGNAIPAADAGADVTIPINTPFTLIGSGTDSDSNNILNYLWEEADLGPQAALDAPDDGQIPLFRVFTPASTGKRNFPKLDTLVVNIPDDAEKLPQLDRTMNFRFTVRDGNSGVNSDNMQVTVDDNSGPFLVTFPNEPINVLGGSKMTVTWDVAGTDGPPVNAATVDILLSTDGGLTYDTITLLASSTPNDGLEVVTFPNINTNQARIMVKASENIFFDISDQNFTIYQVGNWSEVNKIISNDGVGSDFFGCSVSISGDTMVVGAKGVDGEGGQYGAAYIFDRNHGGIDNWGQVKKITESTGGVDFGGSVSISGDTVVVGAGFAYAPYSTSGAACIYDRNLGGINNWGRVKKITASDAAPGDWFGWSVSISSDTVVVGAYGNSDKGDETGSAYIFNRNQGGAINWGQVIKIVPSDAKAGDRFGYSVSISGDKAVIGAYGHDDNVENSGAAYIFDRDEGGANNWGLVKEFSDSDEASGEVFGYSVSISGDTVVVGKHLGGDYNYGSAYIFDRNHDGINNWGEVKKITASDGTVGDRFGYSVSISGDSVVVGANYDADDGIRSGSAYIFDRNHEGTNNWGQVKKITASGAAEYDYFGQSVSIYNDTVLIGASEGEDNRDGPGSAHIFEPIPDINSNGSGRCFIATAAYGSYMEPYVMTLRSFRDEYLLSSKLGRLFVGGYYKYSPPVANLISKHETLRVAARTVLLPVVGMSWIALKIGPLSTVALMLIFIFCFVGLFWFRRKYKE